MGTPYALSSDLVSAWPAKSLAVAQYVDGYKLDTGPVQNAQTGLTYQFVLTDTTKTVTANNAAASAYTVPPQSSVVWEAYTVLRILNLGAGVVTLTAGAGVTLTGTVTVAQYASATLTRTGSNAWTISGNATSKILQVVSTLKQDTFTTSSTSYVDVTGLTATITPSLASSTILVMVSLSIVNTLNQGWARGAILRGATIIGGGTPAGNRPAASFFYRQTTSSLADGQNPKHMTFLDSPASISAQTYKIQIGVESGSTAAVNYGPMNDADAVYSPRLASSITLMEVAP
jgi:hypothetical protein